jgi:peptidoglycan/LPS O-acetylase OafA/YrhL
MKRLECLDGLRGALAVYVMLGHMAPFAAIPWRLAQSLSHGGAAVDVFFILSGFVIVQSLERCGWRPRPFLAARIVRIFPVFLVVFPAAVLLDLLPASVALLPWVAPDRAVFGIWSQGWPASWVQEIVLHLVMAHGLIPDALLPSAWVSFLGAAWSLSTEWQFYVLALAAGHVIRPGRGKVWQLALLFLLIAAAGQLWRAEGPEAWQFSRAFLPNKAHYFALGIASAAILEMKPGSVARFTGVLAATLALCLAAGGPGKIAAPLVWVACLSAQQLPRVPALGWLAWMLRTPIALWLGAISYCLYLVNEPVQRLLGSALARMVNGDGALFTALWLPAATLIPLVAAAALHRWIEQPALHRSPHNQGRKATRNNSEESPTWDLTAPSSRLYGQIK